MMSPSPRITAMAGTLVDRGVDLTNDRAVVMCLVTAGYDAREIGELFDIVVTRARRMRDAQEVLTLDTQLRVIADVMGDDHDQA